LTTSYLIVLSSIPVVPAALFWNNTIVLQLFALVFALLYVALYPRIVRLKAPRRLILRRPADRVRSTAPQGSGKGRAAEAR